MNEKLTGRVRVRGGWFGKLVVQVETRTPDAFIAWRDATVSDLSQLHALQFSHIAITVRLPDVPMPECELPGEKPVGKKH